MRNVADVGLFFWGPRTNRYVLVTLALAIVTGAGLLTTIVWTAITGLRLGAFICLIVTAVLAVIATALFERRSVTATGRSRPSTSAPQLPVDQVLVVNASELPGWHRVKPGWPAVAREVSDLLADKDVMYLHRQRSGGRVVHVSLRCGCAP